MALFKKRGSGGKHASSGKAPKTDKELRAAAELLVPGSKDEAQFVEAMNRMGKMAPGRASSSSDRIPHPDSAACARGHDVASESSNGVTSQSCRRPGCGWTNSYRE